MTYGIQTGYHSLRHKKTSHTTQQAGASSAFNTIVISGSEITYTPSESASKVVYEINFYGERTDQTHNVSFLLQHYTSGAWSQINLEDSRTSLSSGPAGQTNRNTYHMRWVIPAWGGSRDLRVVLATRQNNQEINLHQLTDWDGASSSSDFADTTLIVYSV